MVLLVGGSSHVGKTLLAQKLLEKYKFPYYSLDHLKMGLIRSHFTDLHVDQDAALRDFMWPFVCEIIKTAVENKQNLIIEGCYIPGDWKKSFNQMYIDDIRSIFIVMSEDYIRTHSDDIVRYGDVIEQRLKKEVDIDRLVYCSAMFEEWAKEADNPCLKIDSPFSIDEITEKACELLRIESR